MKSVNLLPNVITTFGLTCGLYVIFKTNMIDSGASTYESLRASVFILLLAAIADFMDGAVARALQAETDFGGLFDSLSDAVTFGVAPSVLVLKSLSVNPEAEISMLVMSGAMIYSICGILRLVRFSVNNQRSKEDAEQMEAFKKSFMGLPIPAAASMVVSLTLFMSSGSADFLGMSHFARTVFVSGVLVMLGYLMVCRARFPSLKSVQVRMPSFHLVFWTVLAVVSLFYGMMYHFAVTLLVVCWAYLAISLGLMVARVISRPKAPQ